MKKKEFSFANNFLPKYFPDTYPTKFPNIAAPVTEKSKRKIFISRSLVPHNMPAVNKSVSPGKKNPKINPVSINMIISNNIKPP